jgi:hypothetical protein
MLSAWCLGVPNSHHRFRFIYRAGHVERRNDRYVDHIRRKTLPELAVILAWGSAVGSAQFAVQVPVVIRLAPHLRITFDMAFDHVRTVVISFRSSSAAVSFK